MSKVHRRAIYGLDTTDYPTLTIDHFLYKHAKSQERALKKHLKTCNLISAPGDKNLTRYYRACISWAAHLRIANCRTITQSEEQLRGNK